METYQKQGYSKDWVNQRMKSIEVRKDLTDEWETRGIKKGQGYAILTDEITKAWSGFSVQQYKKHKGLKKENLRDNMTNLKLVLNMPLLKSLQQKLAKKSSRIVLKKATLLQNRVEQSQEILEKRSKRKQVKK